MGGYGTFAQYYDRLTYDVNYGFIAEYCLSLFRRFGTRPDLPSPPALILDAACGTGSLMAEFMARGVDCIGADSSADMLSLARQKLEAHGKKTTLLHQPIERLDLYGTVDGAVCTLDSLNHILSVKKLFAAFRRIALFLEPGGLFIFDVNTKCKHRQILADNTFVQELDDLYLVWQNRTVGDITEITLDFFHCRDRGNGRGNLFSRETERFSERYWCDLVLCTAMKEAGLALAGRFCEFCFTPPCDECERVFYVARKM